MTKTNHDMRARATRALLRLRIERQQWRVQADSAAQMMSERDAARAEADALRAERDAALAELERAREASGALVDEIDDLMDESDGVAGLHLNGDVADWSELVPGGSS